MRKSVFAAILTLFHSVNAIVYCSKVLDSDPCDPNLARDCCVTSQMVAHCNAHSASNSDKALGYWSVSFCICVDGGNGVGICSG
jgi:hypothetical protein